MTPTPECVELTLPASAEWLALARTTGAAIASRWQFTYDEIADLRLAIDELCLTLIKPGGKRLELRYSLTGGSIEVVGTVRGHEEHTGAETESIGSSVGTTAADLSERILDALVDEHGSESDDGANRAWLRKERSIAAT